MKRKTVGGDERDAFTRISRNATNWKPGEVKAIKALLSTHNEPHCGYRR